MLRFLFGQELCSIMIATYSRMKPKDLSAALKDAPPGEWVALSEDETHIVGHGISVEDAIRSAQASGEKNYILFKMPLPNVGLAV